MIDDDVLETVMDLVRPALQRGDYTAVRYLQDAADNCKNADAARAAQILLNDYQHLREGGLSSFAAIMITVTKPEDLA